jgi:peptidyl-prolyl cis-trans isomerase B (cyclophilin B)
VADSAIATIDEFIASEGVDTSGGGWRTKLNTPPQAEFDAESSYFWDLETNVGTISVKLLPETAPMHVSSTIYLTQLGFYDDLKFHRVITQFMAQGGCPLGSGTGGPGYQYDGEYDPNVKHDKPGLLSMANAGPGTDGSQFFLTFVATPWLDGKHTIFGEIVEGMDVVAQLETGGSESGQTSTPLQIDKATIRVE